MRGKDVREHNQELSEVSSHVDQISYIQDSDTINWQV